MEIDDRVNQLEDEIKVLKNEVQAVLLDIRESYLNRENPFNPEVSAIPIAPAVANVTAPQIQQPPIYVNAPPRRAPEVDREDERRETGETGDDVVPVKKQEKQTEQEHLDDEGEPVGKEEFDDSNETAQEEVNRVLQSNEQRASHSGSKKNSDSFRENGKVDLITVAGLTQWVTDAVQRLGREKTETILDISEVVGLLTPELKNILAKFVGRASGEYNHNATIRDYITSLVELERLLGMNIKSEEMALLSIICQEA